MSTQARLVNLEPASRTYIAALRVDPNFRNALVAPDRGTRKLLAADAMKAAERKLTDSVTPRLEALRQQGLVSSYEFVPLTGTMIINVPEKNAGAAWQALRGVAELGRMARNREVSLDDVVSVGPLLPPRPGVADPKPEYNVDIVNADDVWKSGVKGAGVVVGLVDTGAEVSHDALKGHYRGTKADGTFEHSYNFFDATAAGRKEAYDDHNHGTHTAGTAVGGSSERIIGMAPDAKFIATKVFNAAGSSDTATILKGLSWMLAPRDKDGKNPDSSKAPDIVSNSWGNRSGATLSYLDAWKAYEAAGIIPVVSAGNSGPGAKTIGAPGSYAQSITVGATDAQDKIASFSSRGPSPIKDAAGKFLPKPDVSAPGVNVVSAVRGNGYRAMSGTSMSAPAVAGVTALLLSKYPNLKKEQVRELLTKSSVDLGAKGFDNDFGHGRIDAVKALALADQMFGKPKQPPANPPAQAREAGAALKAA